MSDKAKQRTVLKTALVMLEYADLSDSELVRSIGEALGLPDIDLPVHEIKLQRTINTTLPEPKAVQVQLPIQEMQDLQDTMERVQPVHPPARSALLPYSDARLPEDPEEEPAPEAYRVERKLEEIDSTQLQRIRGLKSPRGISCALEHVDLEEAIKRAHEGGQVLIRYLKGPSAGHLRKVSAKWVRAIISVPKGVNA